jgi:hypothetical protein
VRNLFVQGIEDTNARSNTLIKHFPQTRRANGFSLPKLQDLPKNIFVPHHFF